MSRVSSVAGERVSAQLAEVKSRLAESAERIRASGGDAVQRSLLKEGVSGHFRSLTLMAKRGPVRSYGDCAFDFSGKAGERARRAFAGETVVSAEKPDGGRLFFRITRPVDENRVLEAVLPADSLQGILAEAALRGAGAAFLLDGSGSVIAGPDPRPLLGASGRGGVLHDGCAAALFSRMKAGERGIFRHGGFGAGQACAFAPVEGADNWSVGVMFPLAGSPPRTFRPAAGFFAVFLVLGIAAAFCVVGTR
ncbi:MAG: cache domain-containing protein [Treponematales bacterium]